MKDELTFLTIQMFVMKNELTFLTI